MSTTGSNQDDLDDERLLALLGAGLAAADPIPEWVSRGAAESVTWARIDAELAELVFDSAVEDLAGVRSEAGARLLSFRAPEIEVEVTVEEGVRRLIGQVVPPQELDIELVGPAIAVTTRTDPLGRFTFDQVPEGPLSLRCLTVGGVVQTQWMVL
jgi:hypothetical protein